MMSDPLVPSVLSQIESAIRMKAPVADVARAFVDRFQDPSIQAAYYEGDYWGWNFQGFFMQHMGNWVSEDAPNNAVYLQSLFAELLKQFGAVDWAPFRKNRSAPVHSFTDGDLSPEDSAVIRKAQEPVEISLAAEGGAIAKILAALDELPDENALRRVLGAVNGLANPDQVPGFGFDFPRRGDPTRLPNGKKSNGQLNLEALARIQGLGEEEAP